VLRVKLLLIHAKEFKYKVTAPALSEYEDVSEASAENKFENALVVFTTVEYGDNEQVVEKAVNELKSVIERIKPSIVVIYPYAHLSPELAPPHKALELLKLFEDKARSNLDIPVVRAPFGWYKEFTLNCYGHPLSELSKTIRAEATGVKREITRKYYILTPSGEIYGPGEFDYSNFPDLKILVDKEVYGKELEGGENRVNDYCRKFGFEWEPMSDVGHMRYGPEATLMVELVEDYSYQIAKSLGIPVYKIRGTNMFRKGERAIAEHAKLFGERLYEIQEEVPLIMRYAACFQQFAMVRDWVISYKDLPFAVLEIADSYRYEQPGETALCFRLRRFYMPDLHVFTKNLEEAMEVGLRLHDKIFEETRKIGREYVSLYNVAQEFYEAHRNYLVELARREGKSILVRILPRERSVYYWVLNVEYHIIDELRRPREIATFQIDVGNARRFDIKYRDEHGNLRYPTIIHTAILGSVERYIFTLFDTAAIAESKGKTPRLPTWISPVQVRLIPVSKEHLSYAEEIGAALEGRGFRVDIDDRDETVSRKVRDAEVDWVPYIVVVGDREVKTGVLSVRIRGVGIREMRLEQLIEELEKEVSGYPKRPLTMPSRLSQRIMRRS